MKYAAAVLMGIILPFSISAQVLSQEGMTRELNSNRKPIADVFIKFENSASTSSDSKGNFNLIFQEKNSGDIIFLEEIKKNGYEVVNIKDFEIATLSNSKRLEKDIILAKTGVIEAAKKEYYGISDKALTANVEREKNLLKEKLRAAELSQEEFLTQLQQLQEQYDLQKKKLGELSEKFAAINFDDVEPLYREALKLFKNGDINGAIAILENSYSSETTENILKEEARLTLAQSELNDQKANIQQIKDKQIAAISLLAEMYALKFDRKKAQEQFDQLLKLDSTDLEILHKAGIFFKNQNFYSEAIETYKKIIKHPDAQLWQLGNASLHLGDLYAYTGNLKAALKTYENSHRYYQDLYADSPTAFFRKGIAEAHWKLGETYKDMGMLDTSEEHLNAFKELTEELHKESPENLDYKRNLGVAYEKLGVTVSARGDLKNALKLFQRRHEIASGLSRNRPNDLNAKNDLAIAEFFLGRTYEDLGELNLALEHFTKNFELCTTLSEEQPKNSEYLLNLGFANQSLGGMYSKMGDLVKALDYFKNYLQLVNDISSLYPLNVSYKEARGIALSYLGQTNYFLGNLETSLTYYEDEIDVFEELHATDPSNSEFTSRLSNAYKDKGWSYLYLKDYNQSLIQFQMHNKLNKELFEAYPDNTKLKYLYAVSCQALGRVLALMGDNSKALDHYEVYNDLLKALYNQYPEQVSFKNSLAISFEKLGQAHSELGNLRKAKRFFDEEIKLFKELAQDHPTDLRYKNSLAISYAIMGEFCKDQLNDNTLAIENFKRAEQILIELVNNAPDPSKFQKTLKSVQDELKN